MCTRVGKQGWIHRDEPEPRGIPELLDRSRTATRRTQCLAKGNGAGAVVWARAMDGSAQMGLFCRGQDGVGWVRTDCGPAVVPNTAPFLEWRNGCLLGFQVSIFANCRKPYFFFSPASQNGHRGGLDGQSTGPRTSLTAGMRVPYKNVTKKIVSCAPPTTTLLLPGLCLSPSYPIIL